MERRAARFAKHGSWLRLGSSAAGRRDVWGGFSSSAARSCMAQVPGASRYNRTAVQAAAQLLEPLVPVILHIAIERGGGDDRPELCYTPEP